MQQRLVMPKKFIKGRIFLNCGPFVSSGPFLPQTNSFCRSERVHIYVILFSDLPPGETSEGCIGELLFSPNDSIFRRISKNQRSMVPLLLLSHFHWGTVMCRRIYTLLATLLRSRATGLLLRHLPVCFPRCRSTHRRLQTHAVWLTTLVQGRATGLLLDHLLV